MKEFDPAIITYLVEQLPEIIDTYEDAVLQGDHSYSEYIHGVMDAYQHIIDKFGT